MLRTTTTLTMLFLCIFYENDARWIPDAQDTRMHAQWTPEERRNGEYLNTDTRHYQTLKNLPWHHFPPANTYNSHPWNNLRKLNANDELPLPRTNNLRA
ncbi:Hypothetical predicted protein [Cloeon dipterum]|uniref:Uncharacterized protein n=1 Tax=Cloeon dipterum TaxID=197152 RepID=A0A8S1C568_9INSE|nr:Hypothetical predicted protein [Cloeon dipterum]